MTLVLVKKGMAMKAFLNNVKNGSTAKIKKQIAAGTVQIRKSKRGK